jgi:hypothetical protein
VKPRDGAQHFDRRIERANLLGELHLERRRRAEARPTLGGERDVAHHVVVRVPEDRRAPRADVIDVLRLVLVPEVRALRARDERRLAADRAKRTHRAVHSAGDRFLRASKELFRLGA